MVISFNVKEDSIVSFFQGITVGQLDSRSSSSGLISPYHYMRDQIVIKRGICPTPEPIEIKEGGYLKFELVDRGEHSGRRLVNSYTYKVEAYDDVSLKLVLVDFNVDLLKG